MLALTKDLLDQRKEVAIAGHEVHSFYVALLHVAEHIDRHATPLLPRALAGRFSTTGVRF